MVRCTPRVNGKEPGLAEVALHVERRTLPARTRCSSGSPPSVSGGIGGAVRRRACRSAPACVAARSIVWVISAVASLLCPLRIRSARAYGSTWLRSPSSSQLIVPSWNAHSRALGRSLDHDRLDLGPEAGDPATLELPGGARSRRRARSIAATSSSTPSPVSAVVVRTGGDPVGADLAVADELREDRGRPWLLRGDRPC